MEKQRMGAGRNCIRFGLLILLFLIKSFIFAQEIKTGSEISFSVNPEVLTAGNPFTLVILVDYPVPDEVSVIAPLFNGALSMDRIIITPRMGAGRQIQTQVELRLIPNTAGSLITGSFSVITPQGTTETGPLFFNILAEELARLSLPFFWEGVPREMVAGERITFSLRADRERLRSLHAENAITLLPSPHFLLPEVPQGVILTQAAITPQERENNVVLKLTLIPLEAGNFILPARNLQHERVRLVIPSLQIQIVER